MITVLWAMAVAAAMAGVAAVTGRNAVNAARNRTQLDRAHWVAAGCAARVQAAIDAVLSEAASFEDAAHTWRVLDRAVLSSTLGMTGCDLALEAAGTRLDVNSATDEMMDN